MEDDDYSVISNDERKRPANPSPPKARRRLNIKMEEEKAEEETIEPSLTPPTPQAPLPAEMNINTFEATFFEVAKPDWIRNKEERMMRPSLVRQEGYDYFESGDEYETDQEYQSDSKSSSKRERSQDESSYFYKYIESKDDDETGPSPGSKATGKKHVLC